MSEIKTQGRRLLVAALLFSLTPASVWAAERKLTVVPKWGRFEQSFRSTFAYSNAVQVASLRVEFVSPSHETNHVYGFWDGGKTWRVRFSPDQPGRWTYRTSCSDAANGGLHYQTGEFVCGAITGESRFQKHGLVQVAHDHRHLEHADGTPFFWLADTVWNGARASEMSDWQTYARTRASQDFSAAMWSAAPGVDGQKQSAFTGSERIAINPDFFKGLDAKLEALSRAGILSGIVPLMELDAQIAGGEALPNDQALILVRYVVARWGADPVAWVLAFDGEPRKRRVDRWNRIGREVFGPTPHAPVILFTAGTPWQLNGFRDEDWADIFAYRTVTDFTDDALKYAFAGPFAQEWAKTPARPMISFLPAENGEKPARSDTRDSGGRFTADEVRKAAYWSLMLGPGTGLCYSGFGVAEWEKAEGRKQEAEGGTRDLPLWQKALFMPGAKQMTKLAKIMGANEFWRLEPDPKAVAAQPGTDSPRRYVAASRSPDRALVYMPEDRTMELFLEALPASPNVAWFNPRTGESTPAVAVVGGKTCQFPTPEPGDWVLVMKNGKN